MRLVYTGREAMKHTKEETQVGEGGDVREKKPMNEPNGSRIKRLGFKFNV